MAGEPSQTQLAQIAAKLCAKLGIEKEVQIIIAAENPRIVSVEKILQPEELYVVTFDRQFLNTLNEEEFTAALAHEIGHIWIFSHFPYLHTEALANEIALKSVSR